MSECPFCLIVGRKAPARIIHEDQHTLALLDVNPIAPGHVLVITKDHIPLFTDIEPAKWPTQAGPLFKTAYALARKIKSGLSCDHVSVLMRGKRIPHVHIHLVPSYPGKPSLLDVTMQQIDFSQPRLKPELDDKGLDAVAAKIREARV